MSDIVLRISQNWKSGLTVAMVSLPLSVALSIASGAGPLPGVITGVWACSVGALLIGSKYNIIGAAGALTTVLYGFANFGGNNWVFALPFLAIISGLIILLIWLLRLEKYLIYIPSSVMYGFATGVAVLIAFGQINDALGLKNVEPASHFLEKLVASWQALSTFSLPTLIVFLITFAIIFLLKKLKFAIPGAIIVSVLGIILGWISTNYNLGFELITLAAKYGEVPATVFQLPNFMGFLELLKSNYFVYQLFSVVLVVALISILETLITAKLADKIVGDRSSARQELFGLGLANIVSGLAGGLPATGVFIRTGLNVKSGANDRMSGILAGVFTGMLALVFLPLFKYIPMAVIAGILFNTAIGLIEFEKFHRFWLEDKMNFLVMVLVAAVTVLEDASIGILLGVALALLVFVDKLSKGQFVVKFNCKNKVIGYETGHKFVCPKENEQVDVVVYSIEGIFAYIDAPSHQENLRVLANMPHLKTVILRMRDLFYMDLDGLDMLEESVIELQAMGKEVIFTGINKEVYRILKKSETIANLIHQGKVYNKTEQALQALGFTKQDMEELQVSHEMYFRPKNETAKA